MARDGRFSCFGPSRGKETSRMDEIALTETSEWNSEEAEPDHVGGPDLKRNKRYGFRPLIRYHEGYTKRMWRLLNEGKKNDLQMLIIQFEFAVTMCHEAIHAVRYASRSRHKLQMRVLWNDSRKMTWRLDVHEPYVEDHWQAELGHAWEQEVLDGRIQGWVPSDGEELIVPTVSAWPDRANLYHEYGGFKCSQRGILLPWGPDPGYYGDCYPVSCRYIHEVQQQRFWNKFWRSIEREHGIGLHIRVPKLIGYRQRWVSASSIPLQTFLDQVGGVELMLQAMQDRLEGRDEVIMIREDCLPEPSPSYDL